MAAQLAYSKEELTERADNTFVVPKYDCFSHLSLFSSSATKKNHVSPALANAWAQAIVSYWQSNIANNKIDRNKPLYLLDMAPEDGQLGWLLLAALQHALTANQLDLQFCYLSCYSKVPESGVHPYFREAIASGQYDIALWSDATANIHLHHQNRVIVQCENPLVILGMGYFQNLTPELVGIRKGQSQPIDVAITDADEHNYKLDYQWRLGESSIASLAEPLLAHYRYECNGCTLTLPIQACYMLDAFHRLSGGRNLLLATDVGVISTQQIRLGALCPPIDWNQEKSILPVNFHALGFHQKQYGACVWQQQLDDKGQVIHLTWNDNKHEVPSHAFKALIEKMTSAHPDNIHQYPASPQAPADILKLLRLSHYDPQFLKANIPSLLEQPLNLNHSLWYTWQMALVHTWCSYLPTKQYDAFYQQIAVIAANLGHFALAKECLYMGLAFYGDDATDLHLLACCEAASGGIEQAGELLTRALALQPEHPLCVALHVELQKRLERWLQYEWYLPQLSQPADTHPNPLRLEPLGEEHATSFFYQYRDPQIASMARLPDLKTIDQVQEWITEQQKNRHACFAVIHPSWGFVGVVSAHCAGSSGYFYFWIGSDFQGQGLGQQAAHLLFDLLARHGITEMFTSAYDDNLRSINALMQLGFEQLPFRAQSPDHELIFFHRAKQKQYSDTEKRHLASRMSLCELCDAIQSPLVF